ncbi:MAG: TlpA disulfide reductase family protein [Acidobacteriota bacterium]
MSRTKGNAKRGQRTPLIIGLVLIVAVVVVGGAMMSGRGGGSIAVSPIPGLTEDVNQSLEAFRGKVVILDFWATWCPPCIRGIPDLITLQNKYRDQGLEIVGVSIDPLSPRGNPAGAPAVAPFMKAYGINYTILMVRTQAAFRGYDISQGIPTTYVLDRTGKVVKAYVGLQPLSALEKDINQLL